MNKPKPYSIRLFNVNGSWVDKKVPPYVFCPYNPETGEIEADEPWGYEDEMETNFIKPWVLKKFYLTIDEKE